MLDSASSLFVFTRPALLWLAVLSLWSVPVIVVSPRCPCLIYLFLQPSASACPPVSACVSAFVASVASAASV
jgi:hypothetical protein